MFIWAIYAVIARLFLAASNVIDQYIARAFGGRRIMGAIVLQNFTALVSVILIGIFNGVPLNVDSDTTFWIDVGVIAALFSMFPYLKAMKEEEPNHVMALFQTMPLILIGLAFGLNHEVMSLPQLACAVAMAVGGFCFFWDFKGKGIKPLAALLVIGSALLYAVYYLVLRYAGTKAANPLDILWMIDCGFFVSSLVMMVIYPRAIGSIKAALASSRGKILPLELLNGLLIRFAAICAIMGLTMAPTAGHFAAFAGLLPLFTFAIGAGVSALFPVQYLRIETHKALAVKLILAAVIAAGGVGLVLLP